MFLDNELTTPHDGISTDISKSDAAARISSGLSDCH
jgi:hypothetical protein